MGASVLKGVHIIVDVILLRRHGCERGSRGRLNCYGRARWSGKVLWLQRDNLLIESRFFDLHQAHT